MNRFESSDTLKRLPRQYFAYLAAKKEKIRQKYDDIIDLGVGNPDLPAPGFVTQALQQAAADPQFDQYGPGRGQEDLRQAVAEYYFREQGVNLDPDSEVAILHGSKAGLAEISQCLLNPGDTVLLPNPCYPDYLSGIRLAGGEIEDLPLLEENSFLPDYSKVASDKARESKLLFLNYPNNPTAAVATPEFFKETVAFAREHQICVAHDFAYGTIGFDGHQPESFLKTEGAKETGIEFFTLSKSHNMAGWRIGFAVGNPSVIQAINLLQDHTSVSLYGGIQKAGAAALRDDQSSVRELTAIYEERRNLFLKALSPSGLKTTQTRGSFYVWLKIPETFNAEDFMDKLAHEARVFTAPGDGFGSQGEGYLRIGLTQPADRLIEAGRRIASLAPFS